MQIQLKFYATLSKYEPENSQAYPISENDTPWSLLQKLGVEPEQVKVCFVNNKHSDLQTRLQEGDKVAFFPAVGGG